MKDFPELYEKFKKDPYGKVTIFTDTELETLQHKLIDVVNALAGTGLRFEQAREDALTSLTRIEAIQINKGRNRTQNIS